MSSNNSSSSTFAEETSIGGLKYVGDSGSPVFRRFTWLLIVLGASFGLGVQCFSIVSTFILKPVSMNTEFKEESRLQFPALTICNNNLIKKTSLADISGYTYAKDSLKITKLVFGPEYVGLTSKNISPPYWEMANYGTEFGDDLLGFVSAVAHTKDDAILWCFWRGHTQHCGSENFTKTVTNYGVCFTFNSGKIGEILHVNTAGVRHGLTLYLNVEAGDYVNGPRDSVGFKAMVHDLNDSPDIENFGFGLIPGTETMVALSQVDKHLLPIPRGHSTCNPEKAQLKYFKGNYSRSKCWIECETDYVISKCGCKYFYMPGDGRFCLPEELHECYFEAMDDIASKRSTCSHCTELCDTTSYDVQVSYTSYPSYPVTQDMSNEGSTVCRLSFTEYLRRTIPHSYYHERLAKNDISPILEDLTTFIASQNYTMDDLPNGVTILSLLNTTFPYFYKALYTEVTLKMTLNIYQSAFDVARTNDTRFCDTNSYIYNQTYQDTYIHLIGRGWYRHSLDQAIRTVLWELDIETYLETQEYENVRTSFYDAFNSVYDELFVLIYTTYQESFIQELMESKVKTMSGDEICYEYARQNFLKVNVFFQKMVVEVVTQRADYQIFSVICDIGGVLGLFFGASLLSVVEIFDYFLLRKMCPKSKKEINQHTDNKRGHANQVMIVVEDELL
ncbi:acid-sensing ion channel 2-like [Glandiceps talaboti]